ncbi:MAG: hypothetical protein Pg6A_02290 [Termitinemataceae bacterium]|jgi:hypothetical protein|nr:MAG: hypothetical protein Pg6A_02290 [Termitinemataceae bacterium]
MKTKKATTYKRLFRQDDIARERFDNYLFEKLGDETSEVKWEFYTFLLKQAREHKLDFSGYVSFEQQADRMEAKKRNVEFECGINAGSGMPHGIRL